MDNKVYDYLQDRLGPGNWGGLGVSEDVINIISGNKEISDMKYGVPVRLKDGTLGSGKGKPKDNYPPVYNRPKYPPVTVTGVVISPTSITATKGGTQIFSATVSGTNVSQDVVWTIVGTVKAGTTVVDGVLTVASDEDSVSLVVRATSVDDSTKYAETASKDYT
ncbi:MAG: hypothetical protein LBF97_00665 [Elusimicrobiota bacterium]|jgi:hypothetical protein|nr:hypothetical protein [Elusimicrobiota bacterium]